MKTEIGLNFVTRKDTRTPEFGRAFLDILVNRHPQLTPEFYDTRPERECTNPFAGIEEALPKWAWRGVIKEVAGNFAVRDIPFIGRNYIKRNRRTKYYFSIRHLDSDKYGNPILGIFDFRTAVDKKMDWLSVFHELTWVIEPTIARMHIFTDAETKSMVFGSPESRFWAGPSQTEMREGLTNLGWANVFSEEYAAEVDDERLRSHGFAVEAVPRGKLFTVTDNLFDVVNDFATFSRRRAELKSLFRPGLFQITDEPELPAA